MITPHTNTHLIKSFLVRFVFLYMIKFLKQKKETKPNEANVGKAYTFTATKKNKTSKTKYWNSNI